MKQFERDENHKKFLHNDIKILVCTIAYGMGVNKLDIRVYYYIIQCIIHYDTPLSVEGYIQETGRAGRDGKKSYSYVLYNQLNIIKQYNY